MGLQLRRISRRRKLKQGHLQRLGGEHSNQAAIYFTRHFIVHIKDSPTLYMCTATYLLYIIFTSCRPFDNHPVLDDANKVCWLLGCKEIIANRIVNLCLTAKVGEGPFGVFIFTVLPLTPGMNRLALRTLRGQWPSPWLHYILPPHILQ